MTEREIYGWLMAAQTAVDARREAARQKRELQRETWALGFVTVLVLLVFVILAQVTG